MAKINGETQIIGFFGSTYRTSKMYAMYNAAFEALGLNYLYVPFVVKDIGRAIEGVRHLGIRGIGVTIPYKIDVLPYLDELDDDARRIGAVNTIIQQDGRLIGMNTDGRGAVRALQEASDVAGKKIVLLGAGGAARAIAFAIVDGGGELVIINRSRQAAQDLARAAGCQYASLGQLAQELKDARVLMNATSVGMAPDVGETLVHKELLSPECVVMDLVSNPQETHLLQEAKEAGCRVVYGDRMLLWQGVLKFQLYTGIEPPIEVMEQAIQTL